jgi:hypothetical protein
LAQFFGLLGGNNNINVLDRSPIIQNLLNEATNDSKFIVTKTTYPWYYLLTHGIYPQWSYFVQTIHEPQDAKKLKLQRCKKEQGRMWNNVLVSCKLILASFKTHIDYGKWIQSMKLTTCAIFHNMIIEDERDCNFESLFDLTNARQWQHRLTPNVHGRH